MSLFDALLVAHLFGDWILQTDWQARNKGDRWIALLAHVVIYHAVILVVMLYFLGSRPGVYVAVLLLALTHILLDRKHTTLWLMQTFHRSNGAVPERWLMIAFDQAVHIVLLGIVAFVLTR